MLQSGLINIGLGFLEGFALIISPCIYPILPIILSGSLTGNKKRPIGIIIGFVIIFSVFTFSSRQVAQAAHIDLNVIRYFAYAILIALGIVMLSNYLSEKLNAFTQRLANTGSNFSFANNPQGGFISGIVFGGLIALVWTPCAGPILAAVIVQTVIQKSTTISFFVLLAFSLGAAVPMLIIAFFGRTITQKFSLFKTHALLFRKILGIIIIASVLYMIGLENGYAIISPTQKTDVQNDAQLKLEKGLVVPYPAPPISGVTAWINSKPLQLSELKGKVVLIDFWAYSCINCVRTLPYLIRWYQKYHDKGLVIIGVQTPEFDFEKKVDNVANAVKQYGIQYPVAIDDQFTTWQNYNNQYWPAHYLINQNGEVVYTHFGEGDYDITENNIRYLLGIKTNISPIKQNEKYQEEVTPETYLGYARANQFSSPQSMNKDKTAEYSFPKSLNKNAWGINGKWEIQSEKIVAQSANASLKIHFYAKHVYAVMGNGTNKPIEVTVFLNGKKLTKKISVINHALYPVISLNQANEGNLELMVNKSGLEIYTFTFG